jgi:hypothetical protein
MTYQIRKAVTAALMAGTAIGSGTAMAIDMTTVPATNVLYAGGSTAVSASLAQYFVQSGDPASEPCDQNQPIDYYTDSAGNTQFLAVACASGTAMTGLALDTPIAFMKELNGGSFNGLGPVGAASALTFPTTTELTSNAYETGATACVSTAIAPVVVNSTTIAIGYTSHSCSSSANFPTDTAAYTAVSLAPNMGFADVDPATFGTSTTALGITTGQTLDLPFAPAVSLGLYHALQAAEGLPQDDLLVDMPSLTKDELSSIYTGQATLWTTFIGTNGTSVGAQSVLFGASSGSEYGGSSTATTPSSAGIYLCRRDNYSGTERINELYYGGQNCELGVDPFRAALSYSGSNITFGNSWTTSADSAAATFAASSTGNLLSCLEGHDTVGHFAIGYASVDNAWGGQNSQKSSRDDWRFIKVDGIVPSIENVAAGKYPVYAQSVYAVPSSTSAANYATGAALTIQQFMTTISASQPTGFGKAATVAAVNALDVWHNPDFDGGAVAIPTAGFNTPSPATASLATVQSNPVSLFVKSTGTTLNNCQVPVKTSISTTTLGTGGITTWQASQRSN